jgi:two-component system phosphate regulon sensor histidine kinase PhoR
MLPQRPQVWIAWLCFGGAAVLLLLAWAVFLQRLAANPAILMIGAAALLVIAALLAQQVSRLNDDILNQRESRNALLQAQLEQQRRAVDQLADGLDIAIFLCDPRGGILYANRQARELFRLESIEGRNLLAVTLSYELEKLVIEAARTGETQQAELNFAFPEERVGLARAWFPDPEDQRVFLSVYEISQLRRLERIRQDFVANVSHELRTPMTLIRAMAETLLDEIPGGESLSQRYLTKMIGEVDRLSSITQDLLILSAAESNPVRKQVCDLAEVVRVVTQELQWKAAEKDLELRYVGPESVWIEANASQMKQVALNLVDNAIKYTQAGEVSADIVLDDRYVVLQVHDTGIGIASDHSERIFERFYRVDKGRSRATGGTGLGLSIVKHIVEAHGGSVAVESRLNHGSTFTARLPVGEVERANEPA